MDIKFKFKLWLYKILNKQFNLSVKDINLIFGNKALPDQLSADEEEKLLIEKENGNVEALNTLIEHNLRFVVFMARKYENTSIDFEDLVSIGSIGLVKAIKSFKFGKNAKLSTYAARCIENEILMAIRKVKNFKNTISLDKAVFQDKDGNEAILSDIIPSEDNATDDFVERDGTSIILQRAMSSLSVREKEIMALRYGLAGQDVLTQKEIAEKFGISQSYISRIEKKVLNKLRKKIEFEA